MANARLLVREHRREEATALAREASRALAGSDDLTSRAGMLVHLAEVLRAAGNADDAARALAEAVTLHEEKGNLLPARRCREQLAAMGTVSGELGL